MYMDLCFFCVFFIFVLVFFWGTSTLVTAAMDSDDEIFLTQNTFSQEPFSPELNLEELLGDRNASSITPMTKNLLCLVRLYKK